MSSAATPMAMHTMSVSDTPPEPLRGPELASFRAETQRAMTKIRTVENIVFPAGMVPVQLAAADKPGAAKKKNGAKG